jgi:NADPH:quinone reductase-like Zn-dependent oxidoreductase
VTAVCGPRHVELAASLGAHHVVDYSREDFTRRADRYDVVFDVAGSRSLSACRRIMTPRGIFLPVGITAPAVSCSGPIPHCSCCSCRSRS